MWPLLRKEIARAQHALHLGRESFSPVSAGAWRRVEETVYSQFCKMQLNQRPIWLWGSLNTAHPVVKLPLDCWAEPLLTQLVKPTQRVFLYANEAAEGREKFWWYEGTVAAVQAVLQEVEGLDEWGIVDKKYSWLLCSTHHNVLVGSGEQLVGAMRQLAATLHLSAKLRFTPAARPWPGQPGSP